MNRIAKLQIFIFLFLFISGCEFPSFFSGSSSKGKIDSVPDKTWSYPRENFESPEGILALRADECGSCHTEIYREWSQSTHSQAFLDLQFQKELAKPGTPGWLCLNCHIPLGNQREETIQAVNWKTLAVTESFPNPKFDPVFQDQGVSCATCHLRKDEEGKSYILGGNGTTKPPHRTKIDQSALRNQCQDCHNNTYRVKADLVCYFQTGDEMKESPHLKEEEKYCSNCHMPEIKRSIVSKTWNREPITSHKHSFWGGGIPKKKEWVSRVEEQGFQPSFQILTNQFLVKEIGGKYLMELEIHNSNPGHKLPSGDPERFIQIEVLSFVKGRPISENYLRGHYRIGQVWEWWPEAKLKEDNRLLPMETRKILIPLERMSLPAVEKEPSLFVDDFPAGKDLKAGETRVLVRYVRLTKENAKSNPEEIARIPARFRELVENLSENYPMERKIIDKVYSSP
jgi:hypothetical protein